MCRFGGQCTRALIGIRRQLRLAQDLAPLRSFVELSRFFRVEG